MQTTLDTNARYDAYATNTDPTADPQTSARPSVVAQANVGDTLRNVGEALKPDGIVFGETHGATPLGQVGQGGNFGIISTQDGSVSYFGSQLVQRLPPIPTPFGVARGGISAVGTNNRGGDEGGVGVAYKVPTPAGDMLLFLNSRQDNVTGGNTLDALRGQAQGTLTVSVNIGAAYSVSDGAAKVLAGPTGGASIVAGLALDAAGADAWVGVAWRGSATFENGQLKSINISGVDIPAADIGSALGGAVQQARTNVPLTPNFGSSALASQNDNIQLAFGQSPWDVGFSAIDRDSRGATEIRNGTVNVLNHGNHVTAVTEPVYELGVRYGALAPGQRIDDNAHAGRVIEQVLDRALASDQRNQAAGQPTYDYTTSLNRLMNPYNLDFGSSHLKNAHDSFNGSGAAQSLTNTSRALQGLTPLPVSGQSERPADYGLVRSIFQGELRWPADNPSRPEPMTTPQRGFGF